jgi:hypothetical protein
MGNELVNYLLLYCSYVNLNKWPDILKYLCNIRWSEYVARMIEM